ncbi:hypothetical protein V1478_011585, partial [Vespula squamosa]
MIEVIKIGGLYYDNRHVRLIVQRPPIDAASRAYEYSSSDEGALLSQYGIHPCLSVKKGEFLIAKQVSKSRRQTCWGSV